MIVAGSVLALLLMGLAVDGFVNPADEEPDDSNADDALEEDSSDDAGEGDGLTQILAAAEGTSEVGPEELRYTLDESDFDTEADPMTEEASADETWQQAEAAAQTADFVEIDAVTESESGEDIAYVEAFDPATDTLVLEFDGTPEDAPEIELEYDAADDSTLVFANGVPITMVEGGEDMTPDNIRIVMGGDETALEPQVIPTAETSDDDAATLDEDTTDQDTTPLLRPAIDVSAEDREPETLINFTPPVDPGVTLPDETEPVTDTVETITDAAENQLPDDSVITSILDQISDGLSTPGGVGEMLDARADVDAVFGTGGEDAQTGTFNDDMVNGGEGQDALFGDEGNDTLLAGGGNDELHGGIGNDDLQGGAGVDFLDGGEGQDILDGGGDRDLLFGGDGDDVLYGGAADDFLQGGQGADTLSGGSGNDTLDGLYGDGTKDSDDGDVLWGGAGNDQIILGQGDTANGGSGADTFTSGSYVENAEIAGHVADFDPSEDRIEVIFDPEEDPDPMLEVMDFADGSGADIILNGQVILSVAGAQGLDPNMIELQAMV